MAAKVVIDMRPGKGFSPSQGNEHLRRLDDCERAKKAQWNYDPSREHLNFEIGKGGVVKEVDKMKPIEQRIKDNLKSRGIVNPNQKFIDSGKEPKYRIVGNFILGGNREVMRGLAFGSQTVNWEHGADNSLLERRPEIENWAMDAYKFMCKKYGEKNIVAFVVHLDEANPHVHCTVLPINQKEKFSFVDTFLDGKNQRDAWAKHMANLHTEFAEEVGMKYGMERGDSIKETGAKHRTTEEYRERLWKEARQKEAEVVENTTTINAQTHTIESQKSVMDFQKKEIIHAAARLKALKTMIKNLETHKMDLEYEVDKLQRDLKEGKISKEEADRKLAQINADMEKTKEKIADKLEKLRIAEQKLSAVEQKTMEAEAKKADVEDKTAKAEERYQKVAKEMPALKKQELQKMQALGYKMCALDWKDRRDKFDKALEQMPKEQRDFLDKTLSEFWGDSIIGNVAENISNIASVATALFMGYLDGATTIAASHGGGGSPGSGWGKKDNEDDEAFRRRCFGMAMHMMRPQNKISRKR